MTDVPIVNALIFACLGIGLFVAAFAAIAKIAPFDVWKEVVDNRNVAAAILAGDWSTFNKCFAPRWADPDLAKGTIDPGSIN